MAVVATLEVARGTGVSGKYGESAVFVRKWIVRVDSPSTSRSTIALAPNVMYNASHPEYSLHKAMEFDVAEESGDGMMWSVTWKYYIPRVENKPDTSTGMPADCWAGSGRTVTIPVFKDKDGNEIVNSAGDALEGSERESTEFVITLTKSYANLSDWSSVARTHSNSVNASNWNGSAPRTWKAELRSANKKEMTNATTDATSTAYWEVVWEFVYRDDTWDYQPWDIGYNQLVDDSGVPTAAATKRMAILGADKRPVKSPVALASGVAKAAGQPPDALNFRVYDETDFSVFGTPS